MFVKIGHVHLRKVFLIKLVVKALDSQPRSQIQICGVTSRSTLFQLVILLKLIKWVPGTPGDWVVKRELSSQSVSVALRQLNPIHKKEPYVDIRRFVSLFFTGNRNVFRIQLNIYDEAFLRK